MWALILPRRRGKMLSAIPKKKGEWEMKKKLLSLALALALCLGLTVPAMAAYTVTETIPCKYDDVYMFSEGLAAVLVSDGMCGYIDKTGKQVVPGKYERANIFS